MGLCTAGDVLSLPGGVSEPACPHEQHVSLPASAVPMGARSVPAQLECIPPGLLLASCVCAGPAPLPQLCGQQAALHHQKCSLK